jgi:hypothetical protein
MASNKDEQLTAYATLALYDGDAEISADQIKALIAATGKQAVVSGLVHVAAWLSSQPCCRRSLVDVAAWLSSQPGCRRSLAAVAADWLPSRLYDKEQY